MTNPEKLQGGLERGNEQLGELAAEQAERLRNSPETAGETSPDRQAEVIEKARSEASKEALMSKEAGQEHKSSHEGSAPAIRRITKQQKEEEYRHTLSRVQSHLSAPSKAFSKIIHTPIIERAGDVAGRTIARPNAILAGGICALILTAVTYFLARTFGFQLSGFETIGAFLLGFLLGVIYDFLRIMITGKRSQ